MGHPQQGVVLLLHETARVNSCPDTCDLSPDDCLCSGNLNLSIASRRKIFIHALVHGVRHWAQLSTYLRQKGYKQDWQHDFIFSGVIK
jgi:hypothetical protein